MEIGWSVTNMIQREYSTATTKWELPRVKTRASWHNYFMNIAEAVSERSTCIRRQIGAVAVRDKRILCTGYNGSPTGIAHCIDTECMRDKLNIPSGEQAESCMAVHAEMNVICQAAREGISLKDSIIYCTTYPCSICTKLMINVGISAIIYDSDYPDDLSSVFACKLEILHISKAARLSKND